MEAVIWRSLHSCCACPSAHVQVQGLPRGLKVTEKYFKVLWMEEVEDDNRAWETGAAWYI